MGDFYSGMIRDGLDKATALHVFWNGAPEVHILPAGPSHPWSNAPGFAEGHRLLSTILRNWKADFYKSARFAYELVDGPLHWYHRRHEAPHIRLAQAAIPPDMARSIEGEAVDTSDYLEGLAPGAVKHLQSLGVRI